MHKVTNVLGGLLEDVRTTYSFSGAVYTVQVDVNAGYGGSLVAETARYPLDGGPEHQRRHREPFRIPCL